MSPLKTRYPGFITLAVGVAMFVALHLLVEVTEPGTVAVGVVNGVLASAAAATLTYAAAKTIEWLRGLFLVMAALAEFYATAYFWLAINPHRSADWSAFLRPFGILTWAVAWIIPPIFILRDRQKRAGQLRRDIDEVLAEDRRGHDD